MRLFTLLLFCAVLMISYADPEPKKYKVQEKKNKTSNTTLTDDERKFLREVEEKFGIETESNKDNTAEEKPGKVKSTGENQKLPFPAVIAIEIVNDTDTKTKGKRTIDANLGYGYKTNNGYSYSYFGKPVQDKGKFMIYPYSQKDIPAAGHDHSGSSITHVEIQPSKAFELVSVKDENEGYQYPKPAVGLDSAYDHVKGLGSPASSYQQGSLQPGVPSTLYTTYNGHEFSGLSGHFPSVMPNYFVDPSQLLQTPEYQNLGLTNDHLRLQGPQVVDKRVVPVLVLRIPSSSLKNPTAELFANLPSNYPFSSYLNNVNLQGLVNEYFRKMGYSFAPQVLSHQNSVVDDASNYGRQHYAAPYVQPTYTQSHQSGVQYSAVQPVMAKYPSVYPQRYTLSHGHALYHQPMLQQKYEYQYQHVPQTASVPETYYTQTGYHQQSHQVSSSVPQTNAHVTSAQVEYESSPQANAHDTSAYAYRTVQGHDTNQAVDSAEYEYIKQSNAGSASPSYGEAGVSEGLQGYHGQEEQGQNTAYHPQVEEESHEQSAEQVQSQVGLTGSQNYHYQEQSNEESNGNNLVLSENYPSNDHTLATVYPVSYGSKVQNQGSVQTVSYVTPMPSASKYQFPYKVMVPQTFLVNPSTEKVAYVNSHPVSAYSQSAKEYNPEEEYTVGPHYIPPISKQKPPSYPRNYHSHPKRMAKPDKSDTAHTSQTRKQHERSDQKKSPI